MQVTFDKIKILMEMIVMSGKMSIQELMLLISQKSMN